MSELFISKREEQNQATIDTMRNDMADRTPEERQAKLDAGLDMMLEDREENSEFFARMAGLAALRNTVELQRSDELNQYAQRRWGALGYDATPRSTVETDHSDEVYRNAKNLYGPIGYDANITLRSRNKL